MCVCVCVCVCAYIIRETPSTSNLDEIKTR